VVKENLVQTKLGLGAAVVLLASMLAGLLLWLSGNSRTSAGAPPPTPAEHTDARDERHAIAMDQPVDALAQAAPSPTPQRKARGGAAFPPRDGPKGSLVVRAVWISSGEPAVNLRVWLDRGSGPWPRVEADSRTDATGVVRFANIDAVAMRVVCDLAGTVDVNLDPGDVTEIEFRVEAGTAVTGRVLDPSGRGASNAWIWIDGSEGWTAFAECDSAGRYRIDHVSPGSSLIATAPDLAPSEAIEVPDFRVNELEHDFKLRGPAARVLGQILDRDDQPVPGAAVTLCLDGSGCWRTTSDDEGRFVHHSATLGEGWLNVWSPYFAPASKQIDVTLDSRNEHIVRLETGAELSGVIELEGVPVEGARVMVGSGEPDWNIWGLATTDASGHYRLSGLPPGTCRATAGLPEGSPAWKPRPPGKKDLRARGEVELVAGRTVIWNAELKRDE
jgi:protocatechuate 3,4-dioxygenase beta subunit